ncbi:MAG: Outer membrane protein assembly factor BamB [Candidatus Alkanophagales archaeon MCA70_species_1]|nr:Outer membrane protein assembly factor BamB [Candidatus Alkanophaga volatiphilum]
MTDGSAAVLMAVAFGEAPSNFSGQNCEGVLLERLSENETMRVDEAAWALLALSAVNASAYRVRAERVESLRGRLFRFVERLVESAAEGDGEAADLTTVALAVQALMAAGVPADNSTLRSALELIKAEQRGDGSFPFEFGGNEADALSTALATMALLAAGDDSPSVTRGVEYLLSVQGDGGSFPSYDPVKATALAALTLLGQGLPALRQFVFEEEPPDLFPVNIHVNPYLDRAESSGGDAAVAAAVAYSNVTCEVVVRVRNEGGAFNVSLLADDELVSEVRVLERRASALTSVSFRWRPPRTGVFNLTALVDADDEVCERNETNNTMSLSVPVELPDLSLRTPPGPAPEPEPEPELEFPPLFSNFTNEIPLEVVGFGENFNISFFASTNVTASRTDDGNVTANVTANYTFCERLENVSCYGRAVVTLLWKPNVTGIFNYTLIVDPDNDVFESDETNNELRGQLSVKLPDVYVANFSIGGAAAAANLSIAVTNLSNAVNLTVGGTAERFNVSLYSRRLAGGNPANDTWSLVEKLHVERVFGAANLSFSWTPEKPGIYGLAVLLDADNDVYEANESNNVAYLVTKVVSGAPDVRLLFPRGGEVLSGVVSVRWEASDPDGDALNITLRYSPDGGRSWLLLSEGEENDGVYDWDTRAVPDGEYLLRVEASDGSFTSHDETAEPFFVRNEEESPSQYQGGDAGFYASEAPDKFELAWETEDIGAVPSSKVCVAAGRVFVYCDNDSGTFLTALDAESGEVLWQKPLEKRYDGSWSSPVYHRGRVYIGSGRTVYCFDAGGNELWRQSLGGYVANSCPSIAEVGNTTLLVIGRYGASGNPAFYCLDAESGEVLWVFDSSVEPSLSGGRATATAAFGGSKVYVGIGTWNPALCKGGIYCLDAGGGGVLWKAPTDYGVWGSVTLVHGTLFFGTYNFEGDSAYYAMSPVDGSVLWKRAGISTDSTPAYAFGRIYICGGTPGYSTLKTYCLDPEDGSSVWERAGVGGWTISPAVSSDGKLLVGTLAGGEAGMHFDTAGVYCLDALTGEEIWNSSGLGGSSPVIYDGRVYTSGQGRVYAFGPSELPDINVTGIEVANGTDTALAGVASCVSVTVRNDGSGDVNENFTVELRVEGITVGTLDIEPPLRSGKERTLTFNWTPPPEFAGTTVRLVAEADAENNVTEKDPFNNVFYKDVYVGLPPDLKVRDVKLHPEHVCVGTSCVVEALVENVGGVEARSFVVGFRVEKGGVELNETMKPCEELKAGETFRADFKWTPQLPGVYTLIIEADASHEVLELNESNNVYKCNVTVYETPTPTPTQPPTIGGGGGGGGLGGRGGWEWSGRGEGNYTAGGEGQPGGEGVGAGGGEPPTNVSGGESEERRVTGIPFGEVLPGGGMRSKLSVTLVAICVLVTLVAIGFLRERRKHRAETKR